MRRFRLVRDVDVSGVSGPGHVADGCAFDRAAVLSWRTDPGSTAVYPDVAAIEQIHGHAGATRVVYVDDENGVPFRIPGEMYHAQRIGDRP